MKEVKEILYRVENGELTSKEAAKILKNFPDLPYKNENMKYAKKIKIRIYSKEDNIRINLPAIPIWLVEKLAFIAIKLAEYFHERGDEGRTKINKGSQGKLKDIEIDAKEPKKIFSFLRFIPPCKLVEVDDKDSFVEIYTI